MKIGVCDIDKECMYDTVTIILKDRPSEMDLLPVYMVDRN
jgi:hypothetical protein